MHHFVHRIIHHIIHHKESYLTFTRPIYQISIRLDIFQIPGSFPTPSPQLNPQDLPGPSHRRGRPSLRDFSHGGDAHQAAGSHQQQHGLRLHAPWWWEVMAGRIGADLIDENLWMIWNFRVNDVIGHEFPIEIDRYYCYYWFYYYCDMNLSIRDDHEPWAAKNRFS